MKTFILKFVKMYKQKLENVDSDFWDDIYTIDIEEVDVLNV